MGGYLYILECADGRYYTGSTTNLELRLKEHQNGEGANFTKKRLPVKLVYCEEFHRIDLAFNREKQIHSLPFQIITLNLGNPAFDRLRHLMDMNELTVPFDRLRHRREINELTR